jgi:hypothetical protein
MAQMPVPTLKSERIWTKIYEAVSDQLQYQEHSEDWVRLALDEAFRPKLS